jgi:hypothetical protein
MDISAKVMVWFKPWTELELENFNRFAISILMNFNQYNYMFNPVSNLTCELYNFI